MANYTRYRGYKGVFAGFAKGLRMQFSKLVNTINKLPEGVEAPKQKEIK